VTVTAESEKLAQGFIIHSQRVMGLGVSPAKPSNCFGHLEKLIFHSDKSHIIFHDVKLAELCNNSFEMNE